MAVKPEAARPDYNLMRFLLLCELRGSAGESPSLISGGGGAVLARLTLVVGWFGQAPIESAVWENPG